MKINNYKEMDYEPNLGDFVVIKSASKYTGDKKNVHTTCPIEKYQKYIEFSGVVGKFANLCSPDSLHLLPFYCVCVHMDDGEVLCILRKDVELIGDQLKIERTETVDTDPPISQSSEHPKSHEMKQTETFEIEDANFLLSDFRTIYNKNEDKYVFFYKQKNSKFPIFEIKNNQKLEGHLKITLFDNNVTYIKQQ